MQFTDSEKIPLSKASDGSNYSISEIRDSFLALKLMEMGCMKGMTIEKVNAAPFSGPILIKVFPNENLLAVRYEEAVNLILSKADN